MLPWSTCTPAWDDLLPGLRVGAVGPGVWVAEWDPMPAARAQRAWLALLDAPLKARAERIGTAIGRVRFAASHAAVAALTGSARGRVVTSLAHTRWCAAVGVSPVRIGVDLEADDPRPLWPVAAQVAWGAPGPQSWPVFLDAWVRREAAIKAGGPADGGGADGGRAVGGGAVGGGADGGPADGGQALVVRVTVGGDAPAHLLAVVGEPGLCALSDRAGATPGRCTGPAEVPARGCRASPREPATGR